MHKEKKREIRNLHKNKQFNADFFRFILNCGASQVEWKSAKN